MLFRSVEIIRRLTKHPSLKKMQGTLIAVPVVNVYGFINQTRYLPDRRDLNRFFPGSVSGSLAARLSHVFLKEVVSKSTHGIDLHTGSDHRSNLPQRTPRNRSQLPIDPTPALQQRWFAEISPVAHSLQRELHAADARLQDAVAVDARGE